MPITEQDIYRAMAFSRRIESIKEHIEDLKKELARLESWKHQGKE